MQLVPFGFPRLDKGFTIPLNVGCSIRTSGWEGGGGAWAPVSVGLGGREKAIIDEGIVTGFPTTYPYRDILRLRAFCGERIDDLALVASIFALGSFGRRAAVFEYSGDSEG